MQRLRNSLCSSRTGRTLLAFVAVMAVWNLGCVGFQPLLVRMIGSAGSAGMVCDVEGVLAAPTGAPSSETSVSTAPADLNGPSIDAAQADHGTAGHSVSCGCQSCHAPPSALRAIEADVASKPLARTRAPMTPPSIVRVPLVPPPQAAL